MNWIEIDKILHNLYTAWDGRDKDDYYKLVMRQFKWSRSQAVVATNLIFKQRQNHDNASSSGNDFSQSKEKKKSKKDTTTTKTRSGTRSVSKTTRSRKSKATS